MNDNVLYHAQDYEGCLGSPTPRSRPHSRDAIFHFVGGQEHERIAKKPIERVGQIVKDKAARALDVVANPENSVHLDPELTCASSELLVPG